MSNLFNSIDSSGSGSINLQQFTQSFQNQNAPAAVKSLGASAIFNQLDVAGTGSVSKQAFINGMKNLSTQSGNANATNGQPFAQTLNTSLTSLNGLGTSSSSATDYYA